MTRTAEDIQPPNPTTEEETYYPSRFWWLKRLACAAVLLIAAVIGLRIWAGISIEKRINAKIESYRSAGEPILPEDFTTDPVPNDKNAAILLLKAGMAAWRPPEVKSKDNELRRSCYLADHMDEARLIAETNTESLHLIRQARSIPGLDWKVQFTSPLDSWLCPARNWRQLATHAKVSAEYYHHIGNDHEAIEITRDLVSMAGRIETDHPCLISHLVSISASAYSDQIIEAIMPTLNISSTSDADSGATSTEEDSYATEEQIRLLIAELLDETAHERGLELGACFERAYLYDEYATYSTGRFEQLLIGPVVGLDALYLMDCGDAYVKASQADNLAVAVSILPANDRPVSALALLLRPISISGVGSLDRSFELSFRQRSFSRMAAVALAIRMYELDTGHRPDDLTDLVPQYINNIPPDPFAAGGRPIGYAPDAPRPVLYCVGRNQLDDGGRYGTREKGGIDYDEADVPFFLDGPRPICEAMQNGSSARSKNAHEHQNNVTTDHDQDQSEDDRKQP